jgi:histidinol-phosphate aminotransferase
MVVRDSEEEVNYTFNELLKLGIIVRPLNAFGLPNCLRITVGTMEQNGILVDKLKTVLAKILA